MFYVKRGTDAGNWRSSIALKGTCVIFLAVLGYNLHRGFPYAILGDLHE